MRHLPEHLDTARAFAEPILAEYPKARGEDIFRSRVFEGVLTWAAGLVANADDGLTVADTVDMARQMANVTERQYGTMAGWKREAIEKIVQAMIDARSASWDAVTNRKETDTPMAASILEAMDDPKDEQPKRRGRPPKGQTAMTGAERQRLLQERRKQAELNQKAVLRRIDELLQEINSIPHDQSATQLRERIMRIAGTLDHMKDLLTA